MKNLNKRTLQIEESKDSKFSKDWKRKDRKKGFKYKGQKANDPNWHGKNSQIIKDLCNIAFNHVQGFALKLGHAGNYKQTWLSGLQVFGYDWFAGISKDFRSMLNSAATNIWEFIRSRNAGATNYQSPDIFINIVLGALDIVSTIQFCVRVFAVKSLYTVFNRLTPRIFITAMGINFDDFNANISVYRGRLNLLIAKASALVLPKQFPIYDWVGTICSNIYKDRESNTGREQHYLITKKFFHIFDPTADPNGGLIRLVKRSDMDTTVPSSDADDIVVLDGNNPVKFSKVLDILEAQINAIITDEDCNIIMGDLIKAYGSEAKFWSLRPVDESENITPIYSEEVLHQIHNAILLPGMDGTSEIYTANGLAYNLHMNWKLTNTIKQANGAIVTEFKYWKKYNVGDSQFYASSDNDNMKLLLDTNSEMPSPDEVMSMTRFHNRYKVTVGGTSSNPEYTFEPVAASAIILFSDYVWGANSYGLISNLTYQTVPDSGTAQIQKVSHFDWYPILYRSPSSAGIEGFAPVSELNNVVPVDNDTIYRMHDVDYASLYDIPFSGKF